MAHPDRLRRDCPASLVAVFPTRAPRSRWSASPGSEPAALWVAGVLLLLTLGLGYAGKAVCIAGEAGFWGETRYCYSDVRVLWSFRGFDLDAVPYGPAPPGYLEDYVFEYPPGIAFPAQLIALVTDSRRGFFNLHALTFAFAAALTLVCLDRCLRGQPSPPRRSRWRLVGFALSPTLVLFGMQNWDLWAVALAAFGLAAAARRHTTAAAVSFGLGAAVKWWPALLVITLLVGPWARSERRTRVDPRPALLAAGIWAMVQLPAILISPSGWARSLVFHLRRLPNFESLPAAVAALGSAIAPGRFWHEPFARTYTVVSLTVLVAGALYVGRRLQQRNLDPGDAALALIALLLLTSKVFSPQFVLWLLPVAVVATVPWTPVLAIESANAATWLLFGPWMAHIDDPAFSGFLRAAQAMAVVRALAVAWVLVSALLPREEHADRDETEAGDRRQETQPPFARVPGQ